MQTSRAETYDGQGGRLRWAGRAARPARLAGPVPERLRRRDRLCYLPTTVIWKSGCGSGEGVSHGRT
jgi:hypothetical protein